MRGVLVDVGVGYTVLDGGLPRRWVRGLHRARFAWSSGRRGG
ncbi:MAG: hypothetical protein QXU72_08395 [Thermofilum sp.]